LFLQSFFSSKFGTVENYQLPAGNNAEGISDTVSRYNNYQRQNFGKLFYQTDFGKRKEVNNGELERELCIAEGEDSAPPVHYVGQRASHSTRSTEEMRRRETDAGGGWNRPGLRESVKRTGKRGHRSVEGLVYRVGQFSPILYPI
jgi:hypothetical protein